MGTEPKDEPIQFVEYSLSLLQMRNCAKFICTDVRHSWQWANSTRVPYGLFKKLMKQLEIHYFYGLLCATILLSMNMYTQIHKCVCHSMCSVLSVGNACPCGECMCNCAAYSIPRSRERNDIRLKSFNTASHRKSNAIRFSSAKTKMSHFRERNYFRWNLTQCHPLRVTLSCVHVSCFFISTHST